MCVSQQKPHTDVRSGLASAFLMAAFAAKRCPAEETVHWGQQDRASSIITSVRHSSSGSASRQTQTKGYDYLESKLVGATTA